MDSQETDEIRKRDIESGKRFFEFSAKLSLVPLGTLLIYAFMVYFMTPPFNSCALTKNELFVKMWPPNTYYAEQIRGYFTASEQCDFLAFNSLGSCAWALWLVVVVGYMVLHRRREFEPRNPAGWRVWRVFGSFSLVVTVQRVQVNPWP